MPVQAAPIQEMGIARCRSWAHARRSGSKLPLRTGSLCGTHRAEQAGSSRFKWQQRKDFWFAIIRALEGAPVVFLEGCCVDRARFAWFERRVRHLPSKGRTKIRVKTAMRQAVFLSRLTTGFLRLIRRRFDILNSTDKEVFG